MNNSNFLNSSAKILSLSILGSGGDDVDKTGEVLDVRCVVRKGYADDACDAFQILPRNRETDHDMFRGNVVLKQPLDYRNRQIYRLPITVYDGVHSVDEEIVFNVMDVQNSPPVFKVFAP